MEKQNEVQTFAIGLQQVYDCQIHVNFIYEHELHYVMYGMNAGKQVKK